MIEYRSEKAAEKNEEFPTAAFGVFAHPARTRKALRIRNEENAESAQAFRVLYCW